MPMKRKRVRRQIVQVPQPILSTQPATSTPFADAGSSIGKALGSVLGKFLGSGAYKRKLPVTRRRLVPARGSGGGAYAIDGSEISTNVVRPNAPLFQSSTAEKGVLISHREYIGDIISSSAAGGFKSDTFPIAPSSSLTFPWLCNVAQPSFQQYQFESLVFEFKSFSADALNSTNTALGGVFSCVNYDFSDDDYTTRQQIENTQWAQCNKPSESFIIPVECSKDVTANGGLFYINNGTNMPANADPKQYYLGKLTVATQGVQGTSVNLGSLYVNYKVRLMKPYQTFSLPQALVFNCNRSGVVSGSARLGTTTTTNIYGCDNFGVTVDSNTITMSKKYLQTGMQFAISLGWSGSVTASVQPPSWSISSNAQGWSYFNDNVGFNVPFAAASVDRCASMQIISVDNDNSDVVITLSGGVVPTSSSVNIQILQINGTPFNKIGPFVF